MKRCKGDSGRLCAGRFISSAHGHRHNCTHPTKFFHPFYVRKTTLSEYDESETERICIYVYKTTLIETLLLKTNFLFIFVGFVSQQIYRQYFTVENPFGIVKNRRIRIPRTYGAFNFSLSLSLFFLFFFHCYTFLFRSFLCKTTLLLIQPLSDIPQSIVSSELQNVSKSLPLWNVRRGALNTRNTTGYYDTKK